MYWRFRDSLLKPKLIPEYIENKKKTTLYFFMMVLLFILPNLIYLIFTGGISDSDISSVVEAVAEEKIEYQIIEDSLIYTGIEELKVKAVNSSTFSIIFTDLASTSTDQEFANEIANLDESTKEQLSNFLIIFTSDGIVGGISAYPLATFEVLREYTDIDIETLDFNNISDITVQNEFARIIKTVYKHYQPIILGFSIPILIISGLLNLLIMLLIPVVITFLFNRALQVKFGIIFKLAIYAFTPFVLATTISLGNSTSIFALIAELVSLVYLFIALNAYYLKKVGGIKNEL